MIKKYTSAVIPNWFRDLISKDHGILEMLKQVQHDKTIVLFIFLGLIVLLSSCQKDDAASTVPVISLKSMSKDTLVQFQDSLDIVIFYSDSDGDLGENDPDINSLYVKDSRLDTADYYHVQPLSPPNTALAIQGLLTIKVRNMFLLGNGGNENAYFTIKLKDRAGNWSNEVITEPVVITQ